MDTSHIWNIITYIGKQLKDISIKHVECEIIDIPDYSFGIIKPQYIYKEIQVNIYVDKLPEVQYELICILKEMFSGCNFYFKME